jgi:hypothetical protein
MPKECNTGGVEFESLNEDEQLLQQDFCNWAKRDLLKMMKNKVEILKEKHQMMLCLCERFLESMS